MTTLAWIMTAVNAALAVGSWLILRAADRQAVRAGELLDEAIRIDNERADELAARRRRWRP